MKLKVKNPGIDYMIKNIMDFQSDDCSPFWSDPLYHFYPKLDRDYAGKLPSTDRANYIAGVLRNEYLALKETLDDKVLTYESYWETCKDQITAALSEAFDIDCNAILNDMVCNVSMNPIEPRFLQNHSFDIFYLNSERGFIGDSIHEIIHFVWFHVWNQIFSDCYDEYESPSLKWILSEMVVEPIMRDTRLSSINPYFSREQGGCVYPYFYTMEIEEKPVLDTLAEMYHAMEISTFMKESYAYCVKHEKEIRKHIEESEQ
ncbi:MAG: hypothetical protein LUG88_01730 [Clostridia bacterium]|nr:hypothetical protein [Clostridia bacterium]